MAVPVVVLALGALALATVTAAEAARVELISESSAGAPGGTPSGPSSVGGASADGRFVVFASRAADLVPSQVDEPHRPGDFIIPSSWDVFVRDRVLRTTTLVSHGSASVRVAGAVGIDSFGPVISADGGYVAFVSERPDLVPGQVGRSDRDVFLYDRRRNTSILVSHRFDSAVADSAGNAGPPVISADGRYVAYASNGAVDVVAGDPRGDTRLFVFDRLTGVNTLAARDLHDTFEGLRMSADGRFVTFGKNGDLYLYDRVAGTTVLVSHAAGSPVTVGNSLSVFPEISTDGSAVAFMSYATDLVAGQVDSSGTPDVFVYERESGQTTLLSRTAASAVTTANGESSDVAISADGRFVAFLSRGTNLVAGVADANQSWDEFLFDRVADRITLVSHAAGAPTKAGNRPSFGPSVSPDASRVAWLTMATDVVPGQSDPSPWFNLFVGDRQSGVTTLVGRQDRLNQPGVPIDSNISSRARFSADGRSVIFAGLAGLTTADANEDWDVYVYADEPADPGAFSPCTLLDTRRPADGGALRSDVKRVLVVGGACEVPATAKWVSVKVTTLQATGKGTLRLLPGNLRSSPLGAALAFKKGATRSASYQLRLATDAAGTLALVPFVAGRGTVHAVVEVLGYSE